MEKLIKYFKKMPKYSWIFLAIFALAIFFRVYHFRDWLTFNPDQARDAMIVQDVMSGKGSAVILGPEAGNTRFDLGPWFYHLEILSAKIFGFSPEKLAYPDLLFALLTIPLFYKFIKIYFIRETSLILTFFLSISYFMVRYSRFAFNPNSIPFFILLFLFGILFMLERKSNRGWLGTVLVGIGIGVSIQLHAILIFSLPVVLFLAFLFMLFRLKFPWTSILAKLGLIIAIILVFNTGQIIYVLKNGNGNFKLFVKSTEGSASGNRTVQNLETALLCQSEANLNILTSLGPLDDCDAYTAARRFTLKGGFSYGQENNKIITLVVIALIFSLGGYFLLWRYWKKEMNERKKYFLALVGVFAFVNFLVMIPIIDQASMRYYIILFFLPFIFSGLWLKKLGEIKNFYPPVIIFILIVAGLQFLTLKNNFVAYQNMAASDAATAVLGETEKMLYYLSNQLNAYPKKEAYLGGQGEYFSRFYKPLLFLGEQNGVNILRADKENKIEENTPIFFVQQSSSTNKLNEEEIMGRSVKDWKIFGNVMIIELNNQSS